MANQERDVDRVDDVSAPRDVDDTTADAATPPAGLAPSEPVNTSDSSGLRVADPARGERRRKAYEEGAEIVSGTD